MKDLSRLSSVEYVLGSFSKYFWLNISLLLSSSKLEFWNVYFHFVRHFYPWSRVRKGVKYIFSFFYFFETCQSIPDLTCKKLKLSDAKLAGMTNIAFKAVLPQKISTKNFRKKICFFSVNNICSPSAQVEVKICQDNAQQ